MKSLFSSKTFWFNLFSGVGTVAGSVSGFLPPTAMPYVAAASAVANIGLRIVTNQPVSVLP